MNILLALMLFVISFLGPQATLHQLQVLPILTILKGYWVEWLFKGEVNMRLRNLVGATLSP